MNRTEPSDGGSLLEAAAVGVVGGALGVAVGAPFGIALPLGAVGAVNGAITGWRRIYDWGCSAGPVGFVLDSTWGLPMTAAGVASQALGVLRGAPGYDASLSRRANRMVFRRGFVPRSGFAITVGNVVSGAGDTSLPRRRKLVTDHEDVHVWQARWFGPFYPVLYGGWMLAGGAVGIVVWAVTRRSDPFAKVVESCAYY
ncbi:MAG: hypothetical protein WCA90_08545, partial [Ilumatobacteraceae bacterium]